MDNELYKDVLNSIGKENVIKYSDIMVDPRDIEFKGDFGSMPTLNYKIRGFEVVDDKFRKNPESTIKLPTRGSNKAMAYDFYAPKQYICQPGEVIKIWTDVKSYMSSNEGLILNVRSSMGGKFMLANTQGWIDSDYYSNEGNDGNIGIFLKNISDKTLTIDEGDRVAQGMFISFLVADNGNTDEVRKGGFGSSGK